MKNVAPVYATPAEIEFFGTLVAKLRPRIAVEIGTWLGGTAQILQEFCACLYCVDHWRGDGNTYPGDFPGNNMTPWERFRTFADAVGEHFLVTVFPCVGDSRLWCQVWTMPIDFLYIDGDHSYEGVKADIIGWSPHVRSGGTILGHDYEVQSDCMFPGVAQAVDELLPGRTLVSGTRFWMVRP